MSRVQKRHVPCAKTASRVQRRHGSIVRMQMCPQLKCVRVPNLHYLLLLAVHAQLLRLYARRYVRSSECCLLLFRTVCTFRLAASVIIATTSSWSSASKNASSGIGGAVCLRATTALPAHRQACDLRLNLIPYALRSPQVTVF